MKTTLKATALATACATLLFGGTALASSHREAPAITKTPKVDNTDLYLFRSYQQNRSAYVTILANFEPFQDPGGGPNFFLLDDKAVYSIHVDNNGDALPDLTLDFHFDNHYRNLAVNAGGMQIPVPVSNTGQVMGNSDPQLNVQQSYTVGVLRPGMAPAMAVNLATGKDAFIKPFDNVGTKSFPTYARYANKYIAPIGIPGCAASGRVFVGQRREGFAVNVGKIFDLIHLNPVGAPNADRNDLYNKNVTSIALELPISCLRKSDPVIGAWSTASLPDAGGVQRQVSRVSAPLVNEVVIGLPDKDKFNASQPVDDAQFAKYVTNPSLAELIQALFPGVHAPNKFPRTDLVAAFLTGVPGLNQPANVTASEMMRLNTSIAPKPANAQKSLGVLAGDTAGFPNGRRPGDDVVDIELRVMMGVLLTDAEAPSRNLPYTDQVGVKATDFQNTFPYLNTPLPGATD
jgi:hypothetical protein